MELTLSPLTRTEMGSHLEEFPPFTTIHSNSTLLCPSIGTGREAGVREGFITYCSNIEYFPHKSLQSDFYHEFLGYYSD